MTTLRVHNKGSLDVQVYVTLGATEGCLQDITKLESPYPITKINSLQGYFTLLNGLTTILAAPDGLGLNGNLAFNTPPLNCPCPEWPEGVNLAEFIINNGFQENGQETVDISCVCGANCILEISMDTTDWTANGGTIPVQRITNGSRYDNTGRVGVFPYGCDNCTSSDNPPECVGLHPEYANIEPICTVQRPASGNQGGNVTITLRGLTPVPA